MEKLSKTRSLFLQKNEHFFRQMNVFTKALISRNFLSVIAVYSTFPLVKNTITVLTENSTFFPSNQRFYKRGDFTDFFGMVASFSTFPHCAMKMGLVFLVWQNFYLVRVCVRIETRVFQKYFCFKKRNMQIKVNLFDERLISILDLKFTKAIFSCFISSSIL